MLSETPAIDPNAPPEAVRERVGRCRWSICALLFFATTINYIDRTVLGILAPDLQKSLHFGDESYGNIVAAFQAAYAIGLVTFGGIMDRVGTRRGLAGAIIFWSLASMGHALARSAVGFGVARFALGLGESGNFPAAIKTVALWFPKQERALATGIFNAGSNVGAVVAPLLVPWIALSFGWRWAFIATGALGLIWLFFWLTNYYSPEEHPRLSAAERAYIGSAPPEEPQFPWVSLLGKRQTWAYALGKFLTDPVWWFYLSWLPKYLNKEHGLTLNKIGPPLIVIYLLADFGSIGGGWLSSYLIQRGLSVNQARKTAMLVCALLVTPIIFVSSVSSLWGAVGLIGLAAAAHQGWSANLYTLVSDTFPRRAVGSVIGFGGMLGAIGGMFVAVAVGILLQKTHGNYVPLFIIAGLAYLFAFGVIQALNPASGTGDSVMIYAIGDIHGEADTLRQMLQKLPVQPADLVVFLGDAINRGPDSHDCVEQILGFDRCRKVFVQGNHEEVMLSFLENGEEADFLALGGQPTLDSYARAGYALTPGDAQSLPFSHAEFYAQALPWTLPFYITNDYIFTHSGFNLALPLQAQSVAAFRWGKVVGQEKSVWPQTVVRGHTPFPKIMFAHRKRYIGVDTGCGMGGFLSAVSLPPGETFTARPASCRPNWFASLRGI